MVDVKLENNTAKVLGEFGSAMGRALYAIGVSAQGDVVKEITKTVYTRSKNKKYYYDLTGRLRASLSFVTPERASGINKKYPAEGIKQEDALSNDIKEENTVIIGTNVEYANYVNNGTHGKQGRKFMENGIEPNWDKYQKMAKDIFEGKL